MGGVQGGMVGGQQLYGQAYLDALRQQQQATAQQASTSAQGTRVNANGSITNSGGPYPSGYQGASGGGTGTGTSGSGGGMTGADGQVYVQGPDGHLITQSAYEQELLQKQTAGSSADQLRLQAQLQADAEARRLAAFSGFINNQPVVSRSGVSPDETAARNAAFGQAKDKAGQTALASLKALQDVMAGQGMTGSSVEGQGIANVVGNAANGVNDFSREQLTSDLNREKEVSDQNFNAQVTQRGQTLSAIPSILGLITASSGLKY